MATATATNANTQRYMQGIAVPASSVRPEEFELRTRRKRSMEKQTVWAGAGMQDVIELKKTDILYGLIVRLSGSVTLTPGTGAVASTARWPYDLAKNVRFTANGQSNVINLSGGKLKVREIMSRDDFTDRGISQTFGGSTVNQGTMSKASEAWGFGSATSAIAAGTYNFEIDWEIPICEEEEHLTGAIFAQTSSTDLTLTIDWSGLSDLFVLTGTATAVFNTCVLQVESRRCSIPLGSDGEIVVPDLSVFHSVLQYNTSAIANGPNEVRLIGQGAGKSLLRVFSQLWNGATPLPVPVNDANYGKLSWRFGGNETPEEFASGQLARYEAERIYNSDIGRLFGFWSHDFAQVNAFRDVVDLGTTSEWRQVIEIPTGIVLTTPRLEVVSESLFSAGSGS